MAGKKSTKKTKPEKVEPSLDPILPLPAGTGIPYLRDGEGSEILKTEGQFRTVELSARAFRVMWEQAEALAKKNWPRYAEGPMRDVALAALEAVTAFRSTHWQRDLQPISEEEAKRVRETERNPGKTQKRVNPLSTDECSHDGFVKKIKTKSGEKLWKCENCGLKWPRTSSGDAPESASKARKSKKQGSGASKTDSGSKKKSKKGLKKKVKTKK